MRLFNALNALKVANKRIDQLEKYNLDLANESHSKNARIARQKEQNKMLEQKVEQLHGELNRATCKERNKNLIQMSKVDSENKILLLDVATLKKAIGSAVVAIENESDMDKASSLLTRALANTEDFK